MKNPQYGLRCTVRLFDTVVEQRVHWQDSNGWSDIEAVVPTADGGAVGEYRWCGEEVEVRSRPGTVHPIMKQGDEWIWSNHAGASVSIDRIQMKRARRTSGEAWGDVALLVLMLTLMVGIGQLNTLFTMIAGEQVEETASLPPSPELIARLLRQEFGGEERGWIAVAERPELSRKSKSYYMPAGNPGTMDRFGGGPITGEQKRRGEVGPETVDRMADATDATRDALPQKPTPMTEPLGMPIQIKSPTLPEERERRERSVSAALDEFVGWGFRDWMDEAEIPNADKRDMEDRLRLAGQLIRIDPDDPFSILTVASYAYLSEQYTLCREMYARYLELYPADAAGWNNLALTYKRTGQYSEEERLYRLALALEPNNFFTKNNLAVNLAHQGRFDEAYGLMDSLDVAAGQRPYAELHLAKIAASEGKERRAYKHLKRALTQVADLGTSHHIEFRQDIRLDPSFDRLRKQAKFRRMLSDTYGDDTPIQAHLRGREVEVRGG